MSPLFRPANFLQSRAGGGHGPSSILARNLPAIQGGRRPYAFLGPAIFTQSRADGGHTPSSDPPSSRNPGWAAAMSPLFRPAIFTQSRAGGGHGPSSISARQPSRYPGRVATIRLPRARHSCDPGRAATMGLPLFRPTTFPLSRAGGGHGPSSISARNLPAIQGGRRPWAFLGTCVAVGTSATFADWRLHNVMDPIRGALVPLRATPERERARRRPMAADCPALCPKPAGLTKAHGRRPPGTLPETCGPGEGPWPPTARHFTRNLRARRKPMAAPPRRH